MSTPPARYPPPPSYPTPPGARGPAAPAPEDLAPTPEQPRFSGVKVGTPVLVLLALLGLGGAYYALSMTALTPDRVYEAVSDRLGEIRCPAPEGTQVDLHFLVAGHETDAYAVDAPNEAAGACLANGLGGLELTTGRGDELLLIQARAEIGAGGQPRLLAVPRRAQRLGAEWNVGVLGEDIPRGEVADIIAGSISHVTDCYAEYRVRVRERVPAFSWHTQDKLMIRGRLLPDGSFEHFEIGRAGFAKQARDWTDASGFRECITDELLRRAWPKHAGTTSQWVNTTFIVTPEAL